MRTKGATRRAAPFALLLRRVRVQSVARTKDYPNNRAALSPRHPAISRRELLPRTKDKKRHAPPAPSTRQVCRLQKFALDRYKWRSSSFTVSPRRCCGAVPAFGEDFSSPEKVCSSKPSRSSLASRRSPHDESLRPRTGEKHRAGVASAWPAHAPPPCGERDVLQ